jgi:pyrroloquinoline quinone (PQQ) biosynthesis protein C
MTFFEELQQQTAADRQTLLSAPIISDCLAGRVSRASYGAFLTEAYHHVKHTVPLLMACGSRLPERLEWLRRGMADYIAEEYGHERWILNDLAAAGFDAEAAAERGPGFATELMVSYAYDTIERRNPAALLGMVLVLEGTSAAIATQAAEIIETALALPRRAFTYLRSHGSVDLEHIRNFESLVNRLDDAGDRAAVVHCARAMYRLYGDVFRSLPRADGAAAPAAAGRAAA